MATNLDQDVGDLRARIVRLEAVRHRLYDLLPLTLVLAFMAGVSGYGLAQLATIDDRLDRLETRVERFDERLGRLETRVESLDDRLSRMDQVLGAVATKLGAVP